MASSSSHRPVHREFHPATLPFAQETLQVNEEHKLHVEQVGSPSGKPVVVLHGGPGGGCEPYMSQFFNPNVYRVILFDQRGAGKSTPFASLNNNTTWDLVSDIEKVREHLGIDRWVVFGGSWGSTLALAYAEKHPERVKALILRGIFTLRRKELIWFYQDGASLMFPDEWERFLAPIPSVEHGDLLSAYHRRLTGNDEEVKLRCAQAWTRWEMATSRLLVDPASLVRGEEPKFALAFARIESHYFVNGGFFEEEGQLIKDAHKIAHIPTTIAQGRYDMVCPAFSAWDLHKALGKQSNLVIVPDAGHSAKEPGIRSVLIEAAEKYEHL